MDHIALVLFSLCLDISVYHQSTVGEEGAMVRLD